MDSFCMVDNTNRGRCQCSNRAAELDKVLEQIQKLDEQSYAMATEGVERINMGDSADEVNAMANKIADSMQKKEAEENKKKSRSLNLSAWDTISLDDEEENAFSQFGLDDKTGDALQAAVHDMCVSQMPECSSSVSMLKLMYAQQIKSDCSAYENSLKKQKNESAKKLQTAQAALREAALEQHQNQNKYDLGQCTIRFKECMQTTGGCGDDFSKCASMVGYDNSQTKVGKKNKNTGFTITTGATSITIAASTYDTLAGKKVLCESVTKQCVKVKDKVWDAFLRESAPEIKSAELIAESNIRMNCIANISDCFQKACKDNMDPNDPEGSYDMCLTRPETMRSLCKVQIDPCEAAEPKVFDYVKARLASMRVDSCTKEVKACLQSDDRCGEDYSKCIGLDLVAIRDMCPLEKLVGCQKDGKDATWDTIDNIVQGIYLDVDNSLLTSCQNAVNAKYVEICGDGDSCAAFDSDELMGADSLISKKANDGKFIIEGLTNFGKLKLKEVESTKDDVKFGTYELDINDYSEKIKNVNAENSVKERVLATLQTTQNKINQKIAMLTSDPKVDMCVNGRDMKQIRGSRTSSSEKTAEDKTTARFPHLIDSAIMSIINAGIEKASTNYAKKYDEVLNKVMEEQGDETKAAMCAAMASNTNSVNASVTTSFFKQSARAALVSDLYSSNKSSEDQDYQLRLVIDGMKMKDLLNAQKQGKGTYVQTDSSGSMISQIIMTSLYSAADNTCKVTITTQVCENMKDAYDTYYHDGSTSSSCGSGGIFSWGCNGGSFSLIGGGGSTSTNKDITSISTYKGTHCQKMMAPTTRTEEIKM